MIRAVLDTNVLVSAILTPSGIPAKILLAGKERAFICVFSPAIFLEIRRVLAYPKLVKLLSSRQLSIEKIEEILSKIVSFSIVTPGVLTVDAITTDPSDNIFWACAKEGRADYVVSGDAHLLECGTFGEVKIVTPVEFWAILEKHAAG